jgi:aryl-alcohol dehydrogenase-like predicted oxidoreductase
LARIGSSDLDVFPLCLGGNVFGWTADEPTSFDVLDAYAAAGGNFIDTADSYSAFHPGNSGGESETIIGNWMAARGNRDDVIVATKVGQLPGRQGLAADNIRAACEDSLRRLQTDRIDLYYAHKDDPDTPLEETLAAFGSLIDEGKVRYVGASNYSAERLTEAMDAGPRSFVALQPHYNLVEREYEQSLRPVVERQHLACLPYFALARGFLTGKYREGVQVDSPRASRAEVYLDDRGRAVLWGLDEVAAARSATVAAVAIAWLRVQPTVVAPLASARNVQQLSEILPGASLDLSAEELERLASAAQNAGFAAGERQQ